MDFGEHIKKLCQERNISMYQLSKMSGVPATTLSNYVHGVQPTLDKADTILKALGAVMILGDGESKGVCKP